MSTRSFILPRSINWVPELLGIYWVKVNCLLEVTLQLWHSWIVTTRRGYKVFLKKTLFITYFVPYLAGFSFNFDFPTNICVWKLDLVLIWTWSAMSVELNFLSKDFGKYSNESIQPSPFLITMVASLYDRYFLPSIIFLQKSRRWSLLKCSLLKEHGQWLTNIT